MENVLAMKMFWTKKKEEVKEVKKTKEVDTLRVYIKGLNAVSYDLQHPAEGKCASVLNFHKGFFKWYYTKSSDKFTFVFKSGEVVFVRSEISFITCVRKEVKDD